MNNIFTQLEGISSRPEPFEFYTAVDLWTDGYTSKQMLDFHLNTGIDVSSRRGEFIDRSVKWIASHFGIGPGSRIADFGCGPGLYANRLAQLGARVTGIDFSERSISYARETAEKLGLTVEYIHRDYMDFKTQNRFNLILMIMCDFCALSPSQRMKLLTKFHSLLLPGGYILLDVYSMNSFKQREETSLYTENLLDGFWSGEKYYGFLNTFKYDEEKVVLDKYTIIEAKRTRTVYNWLQYFSPESLSKEFQEAGFTEPDLYGDVAGNQFDKTNSEFAVIGTKP